ncbi:MAG TPA: hypothetical protein VGM30_12815 [Puia sp.]|jgi:hypothetical protein
MENETPEIEREGSREDAGRMGISDQQLRRRRDISLRRTISDYGMGSIIFLIGIVMLIGPKIGFYVGIDDVFRYIFAGLCLLYGGFRVYRGSKKNYFN